MKPSARVTVCLTLVFPVVLGGCPTQDPGDPQPGPNGVIQNPVYGYTVSLATPPPPISGGTLLVTADGLRAVAADPDRDRIFVANLSGATVAVSAEIPLAAGSHPGRSVEDAAGLVHVVLRDAGAVATVDVVAGKITATQSVCPAPRGIDYDATADTVVVACAGGELVTLPAAGGAAVRTVQLDRDLRDVIVDGNQLWVSRFRSAEILRLDNTGAILARITPSPFRAQDVRSNALFEAAVAWRMVKMPASAGGGVALVHQRGQTGASVPVSVTAPGGYGSGSDDGSGGFATDCNSSIVHTAVTVIHPDGTANSMPLLATAVLPVDVAINPYTTQFAIVAAGNSKLSGAASVFTQDFADLYSTSSCVEDDGSTIQPIAGQPIATVFIGNGTLLVQSREPAFLQVIAADNSGPAVSLSTTSAEDTGHTIFHSNSGAGLACASCHPEGGEDGRTWTFDPIGPRRTQSLRGGVLSMAPFHWDGAFKDMTSLVANVLGVRMSGPSLADDQLGALSTWLNASPLIPQSPPADAAAVARGRTLFSDASGANCISCHNDANDGNAKIVDVGTGGSFHVAALTGLGFRAPFIHDGCAATLADRFSTRCGGGDNHGHISQLTPSQVSDLVAFLNTL